MSHLCPGRKLLRKLSSLRGGGGETMRFWPFKVIVCHSLAHSASGNERSIFQVAAAASHFFIGRKCIGERIERRSRRQCRYWFLSCSRGDRPCQKGHYSSDRAFPFPAILLQEEPAKSPSIWTYSKQTTDYGHRTKTSEQLEKCQRR